MKVVFVLLLLWPTYSHAECDFAGAVGDWVGLLIPHHRHDPPRHSLYITKDTLTLNGLEHKCQEKKDNKFLLTLKNPAKKEEYFKRCLELMYRPGALSLLIYSALNSTTKSTSEVGDLVKECNDPKRKNLGSIGSLRTDRATGIFVHRGLKAEDVSMRCPELEMETTGVWTRPFAGGGHEFFSSIHHCTNTMESISSCRGRERKTFIEWNVTMSCDNDKTQGGSDTSYNQSSVKMVSHFACVGGFNLNFGKRPFVASILMSMSDAEDPPMVCLAHMFIIPYKKLLMIPCELFLSYRSSYGLLNENLFLIKERYSSVCSESSSHNNYTHGSTTVRSPGDYQSTKPNENLIMMDDLGDSTEFMIQQLAIENLLQTTEMTSSIASSMSRMTYRLLVTGMMGIMILSR